jgi:hypothetical protein
MGKENVGAGTPLPAVTPTPKQTDAGPQVIDTQVCDTAKTVAQNNAEPPITEQANAAETEKLDGILETIRGPSPVSAEPETIEVDELDVDLGAFHVVFKGEDATVVKQAVLKQHMAKHHPKHVAVPTKMEPTYKYACAECQFMALEDAGIPAGKPSHVQLKDLVEEMIDDLRGGRIVFVHGGSAAARTECVNKALHRLRIYDFNRRNINVSEQDWKKGYFAYIFHLMFGGKRLKE